MTVKNEKRLKILEVNNIDLPGRRFNGYDLVEFINKDTKFFAKQMVIDKLSNNKNVVNFFDSYDLLNLEKRLNKLENESLSVHSQLSLTSPALIKHKDFKQADLVHYHLIHNTKLSLFSLIKLFSSRPTVLSIHDPWLFTGRCVHPEGCNGWKEGCANCNYLYNLFSFEKDNCKYLWKLKQKIYKKIDIDFIVSTQFMMDMFKTSPLTSHFKNVHLIPFGIDLNNFSNRIPKIEARKKLGIGYDDVVLFFRAQTEFKGTDYIIEALENLTTAKKITLLTCSEVGLLSAIQNKYNMVELGHINDEEIVTAYNACDIFLMPSRGESFGLMAVEAMACSKPVIIFNNTALPYVTFAPDCGVLVENKNVLKLMEAIKWLVEDEKERKRRGEYGRKLVEKHYDINKYNTKMISIYEKAYKRQKNKKYTFQTGKIDYLLDDVQLLIKKLRKLVWLLFEELPPKFSFEKYENLDFKENNNIDINYSLDSVQMLISEFNDELYNYFKKKGRFWVFVKKVKTGWRLAKYDRKKLKIKICGYLETRPILYKVLKSPYIVLRKTKGLIVYKKKINNKIKELELQNDNLIQVVMELKEHKNQMFTELNNLKSDGILIKNEVKYIVQTSANDYKNIFYYHGGSGNHGCEALVKTLVSINDFKKNENCLYSYNAEEDYKYGLNSIVKYIKQSNLDSEEITNDYFVNDSIALSIGGDNYCGYDYGTKKLAKYNRKFNEKGIKTALIGCSIEPEILTHSEVLDDLKLFSLITARESITYNALLEVGIDKNIHLIPDSAFTLKPVYLSLPSGFKEGKTIGLNVSDLVQSYDKKEKITYNNYKFLIEYIINYTDYQIALIPHVVQKYNDDMEVLTSLFDEYKETGRVILINEYNCNEIKGFISRCKIFIGARTHATIAAYSSYVPTLALGYSVKSRGIAKDIFGTEENYVLAVQKLTSDKDLTAAFKWIEKNYVKIKKNLNKFMPDYIEKCYNLKPLIENLKKEKNSKKALASPENCTGCSVCVNVCPKKSITMKLNKEGFFIPVTDYSKCIDCDLCKKKCPINNTHTSNKSIISYAAKNKNINTRLNSSSGGIFRILAEKTLENKGVIFGAGFDNNNEVCHLEVNNIEKLIKLQRSKYVQSNIKDSYKKAATYLKKGKEVLFSGTPCQIQGLKTFLNEEYENLTCVDVVCHGVPSPKIFKNYCKELEKKFNSQIININFRNKDNGWKNFNNKYEFNNGKILNNIFNEDLYMKAFLQNLILRNSCYDCKANNFRSKSDITLGDYWGIDILHPEFDDDKGVSLVILKTKKGQKKFEEIKPEISYIKTDINEAIKYNLCLVKSVFPHYNRENFFSSASKENITDVLIEYLNK